MGTLLPAWIHPRVRSVSMLVSSLLVNSGAKGGAVVLGGPAIARLMRLT